jgi:predicted nucleic acid-binding protein
LPKNKPAIEKAAGRRSIFVDSSAWIALFSRRDQNHDNADRVFRKIVSSKQPVFTSNLVLAEIHRLLLYRAGLKAAIIALERIEASPLVAIEFADAKNHKSAINWLKKFSDFAVSYTDAISFSMMEAAGCRVALSYDRHFQAAGFEMPDGARP